MNILVPITVTDAMLTSSTIAEPAAGETAWVSAGTYVVGDIRIRATTHRKYVCILGHTGRAQLPEADPLYWDDVGPTLKWSPFDSYTSTAASSASPLTYVVSPNFFNALGLYGLAGSSMVVTVKDGPGGATLNTQTISLFEESGGLYEYLFAPARPKEKVVLTGLPIHPTAEVTITVTGASTCAIGLINIANVRDLVPNWGGTEYGATAEPITYSRIKIDEATGETYIKRGAAATGMRASVVLPIADANFALQTMQQVLDVPASFVASGGANYAGLNVFGLGSASLSYETSVTARLNLTVKGLI